MARTLIRPAGPDLVFPAAGGTQQMEIPKDAAYRGLWLHFSAAVVIGTGTTPSPSGIFGAIRAIRVLADGKLPLVNVDGPALLELNEIWFGSLVPRTPALAAATATYKGSLYLPFASPYLYDSAVSLLPAVPLSGLNVQIDIGAANLIYNVPGTASVVYTVSIDTHEVLDLAAVMQVSPMIMSQSTYNAVSGNAQRHRLQDGNRIAQILASARTDFSGSVPAIAYPTTLLTECMIEHSVPGIGPQILRNEKYQPNRDRVQVYGSGVYGGKPFAMQDGHMLFNFVEDGRAGSALDVSGDSRLHAIMAITAAGTNPRVVFTHVEMIPTPISGG